jgi:hypothetical protein
MKIVLIHFSLVGRGFFLTLEDKTLPEVIQQWDVTVLRIDPAKPHTVQKAQVEFWEIVDARIIKQFSHAK